MSVDPDPNYGAGPIAPWLFGTWVHTMFTDYVRSQGYQANITYDGLFGKFRPDVFDPESKQIWELKPESCSSGDGNYRAQRQLGKYIEEANKADPLWQPGLSSKLLPNGPVTLQGTYYNGSVFDVTFYPDPNNSSGLIFYNATQFQSATDRAVEQIGQGNQVATPVTPTRRIPLFR